VIPNECIIIGGGKSILEGLNRGLQPILASKFVILINYAYRHFPGTFLCFQDKDFYVPLIAKEKDSNNPDIYNDLKQLPLIIGPDGNGISEFKLDNTILLNNHCRKHLTGMFAIYLAEQLIEAGTIFLLGFDWPRRTGLPEKDPNYNPIAEQSVHYYNDIKHRGSNKISYYENHDSNAEFIEFINKNIKIYNVSLDSNIDCFEKISYNNMFSLFNSEVYNQEKLRVLVKEKLCIK
jgi:hypothetical protein